LATLELIVGQVEVVALEVGDIAFTSASGQGVGVEHKTVAGLVNDATSGRLYDQLLRLRESYEVPILLAVGDYAEAREWSPLGLRNLFLRINLEGIITQRANTLKGGCQRIKELYDYLTSERHTNWFQARYYHKGKPELLGLTWIRGIGEEHATALLEHFGLVGAVANASAEELKRVKGIGTVRANTIVQSFRKG